MEDRNVHQLAQPLLDDEAFRRLDVLEVDAAEGRTEEAHAVDEFVGILGRDFEVDRIDIGEALEQHRLAFHDRLRGQRAEIAEAEDGGAIGNDGDHVAARRIIEGAARILGNGAHGNGDTRRVGEAQIALRRHRFGGDDLQLAGPSHGVEFQRLLGTDGRAAAFGFPGHDVF